MNSLSLFWRANELTKFHIHQQSLCDTAFMDAYYRYRVMLFETYHIARVDVLHSCAIHQCHTIPERIQLWIDSTTNIQFYYCCYSGRHHRCNPNSHSCLFLHNDTPGQNQKRSGYYCLFSGIELYIDFAPVDFQHEVDTHREFVAGTGATISALPDDTHVPHKHKNKVAEDINPWDAKMNTVATQIRCNILQNNERESIFCHQIGTTIEDSYVFWGEQTNPRNMALGEISPHWISRAQYYADNVMQYLLCEMQWPKQNPEPNYAETLLYFVEQSSRTPSLQITVLPLDSYWNDLWLAAFLRRKRDCIMRRLRVSGGPTAKQNHAQPPTYQPVYIPSTQPSNSAVANIDRSNNILNATSDTIRPYSHMTNMLQKEVSQGPFTYDDVWKNLTRAINRVKSWHSSLPQPTIAETYFIQTTTCHFIAVALAAKLWTQPQQYGRLFNKDTKTQYFRELLKQEGLLFTLMLAGVEYCLSHMISDKNKMSLRLNCVARQWVIPALQTYAVNLFDAAV